MRHFTLVLFVLSTIALSAQSDFYKNYHFTHADTLRGSLRPQRTCFDVLHYGLYLRIDPKKKHISGHVDIKYAVEEDFTTLQLDLFQNMKIQRILFGQKELKYDREANAVFVHFSEKQLKGNIDSLSVYYSGQPQEAHNPPWDGGFVWTEDKKGRSWFAVACEGDGASLWWPNKDHLSDEPDSMTISIAVPEKLTAICNGNLRAVTEDGNYVRYEWAVTYPIDNYNVTFNVGHYTQFSETYHSFDKDSMRMDFYVIDYNEDKAKKHFQQTEEVLRSYEYYMGKYPFWNDGFALVETPYLGMEHQGAIAYGNRYMRGYLGGMIPLDMDWDYIIVHETGHEYYGNSIGCSDLSEMWIQESFTTYLESLYVEYTMSKADAIRYLAGQKFYILNKEPIIGPKGVNFEDWSGSDHYFKGAWVLHTLRNAIGDDKEWFRLFHLLYQENKLSQITSDDITAFFNKNTKQEWNAFFDQYLRYPAIPIFQYQIEENDTDILVRYRWKADVSAFNMPVLIGKANHYQRVTPSTSEWQEIIFLDTNSADFQVATELFLVKTERIL